MKIKYKLYYALIYILISAGCERIPVDEPIIFRVGEKYRVDWNLSFSIDSIQEYRCPRDVICVWAGDVNIYFSVYKTLTRIDTMMCLYNDDKNPILLGGYTWRILAVDPLPETLIKTDQEDFRIKMMFSEN